MQSRAAAKARYSQGDAKMSAMRRSALAALWLVSMLAGSGALTAPLSAQQKTLKFVPEADLRSLDPIWTTAYITRNYGYMVYDTLFAVNEKFEVQPQMVDKWSLSDDKLTYTFVLRDGLKWHDGQPVRPADCIASIERWAKRDALGQKQADLTDAWAPVDDKTFTLRLKKPFSLTLDALAKPSSNVPFIMPERVAKTDAFTQITESVGSGPFKLVKEEWVPGNKVVFVKNTDYVPRSEPPSWASGGKVAKVERIEWLYMPEYSTAAAALGNGEVDWWEAAPPDLAPVLAANPDIKVEKTDPLGSTTMLRFNHLYPPFDNVKMRQAVLAVTDQAEFMSALAGDPANWNLCASFFTCGTPMASNAGSEALTGKRDFDKAKRLIAEAGYKGEKIVVLDAVDTPTAHAHGLVVFELLKKLGLNPELATSDWGTLVIRRASKKPIAEGGWSIFGTGWTGVETLDPSANLPLATNGGAAWFGWPSDDKLEALRADWLRTSDGELRQEIAVKIQQRAFETLPYIPTG